MKNCSKCGTLTSAFYRDSRAADGLQSQCKFCHREGLAASYRRHRVSRLDRQRQQYAKSPDRKRANARAYYAANRDAVLKRVTARSRHA